MVPTLIAVTESLSSLIDDYRVTTTGIPRCRPPSSMSKLILLASEEHFVHNRGGFVSTNNRKSHEIAQSRNDCWLLSTVPFRRSTGEWNVLLSVRQCQ